MPKFAASGRNACLERPEDALVLRALRHIEHVVELAGGVRIRARIRALVDEDWTGRRRRISDVGEGRMEPGLPRALVEQLRQPLRPRRFARRMQVLRSIEQRIPGRPELDALRMLLVVVGVRRHAQLRSHPGCA